MDHRRQRESSPRVASLVAALVLSGSMAAHAAPKLSVPVVRREIGALTAGESVEVEFPLKNTGADPLQIRKVTTSCGCTTAHSPARLEPGEQAVLRVRLDSSSLWSGPVEKQITVLSDDPDQPSVVLQLTAEIRPLVRITPASPLAVRYRKGEVIRQVFTIASAADSLVRITGAMPGAPGTAARLLPAEAADPPGLARVEVTARPPAEGGDFLSSVVLETAHPKLPKLRLVLHGIDAEGITVNPSFLYLDGLTAGAASARLITVSKPAGKFRILGVETGTAALQAEVRAVEAGSAYEIRLYYRGGWSPGKTTGKITVTTDDASAPQLEIGYAATVP